MSINEVYLLAGLLRSCGDRVLNGESKLRLTPSLLNRLNACFSQIATQDSGTDFHVIPAHGSQLTQLSQLDFLHDFVQKTPGLTISGVSVEDDSQRERRTTRPRSYSKSLNNGAILDLSRFRQLHHLEVRGGTVESVAGVSALRGHIRTLMLIRMGEGDTTEDDLLRTVLAGSLHVSTDAHKDAWWPALTQLVACYCNLQTLGPCLSLAPRLVVLDLSHNALKDEAAVAAQLGVLLNLKYLNLSFNRLTSLPELRPGLQYLVISHNYISHLDNVELLTGLLELNIVMNHLADHSELKDLVKLPTLHRLYLSGNPLSFHSRHRRLTCANLPRHAAQVKFLLDGKPLSKSEKEEVLSRRHESIAVSRVPVSESAPNLSQDVTSDGADRSILDSQRLSHSQSFSQQSTSTLGVRRNKKIHDVVITDVKDITHKPYSRAIDASKKNAERAADPGKALQRIPVGFDTSTPRSSPLQQSCVAQMVEERLLNMEPVLPSPPPPMLPRTVIKTSSPKPSLPGGSVLDVTATSSNYATATSSNYVTADDSSTTLVGTPNVTPEHTVLSETSETAIESRLIGSSEITSDDESGADSEGEDNDRLMHIAQKDNESDDDKDHLVFLSVSSRCIKELATDTLKVLERWPIATLIKCSSSGDGRLNLFFKSANDNRRIYKMSQREIEEVLDRLGNIIEARNVSAVNRMKVIHCGKCLSAFTKELRGGDDAQVSSAIPQDPLKGSICCPFCSSKFLIQAGEKVLPDTASPKTRLESKTTNAPVEIGTSALQHSTSDSSIGSAVSLDSCSDPAALTGSHCVSPAPTPVRRCDSDIDIISNPSLSSIEVLEESSRSTPGRKRSSEERQVVAVPSLLPVPETTQPLPGLTESSSSGSMTDSVCTAYENGMAATSNRRPASSQLANSILKEEPSRESSPMASCQSQEDTISAMLNGLLEKATIDPRPPKQKAIKDDILQGELNYNFSNLAAIDHRLKLHLYLSVLEDKEELFFILRTEVLTRNPVAHYEGVLVVSSDNIYVLKITGPEDKDRIPSWLSRALVLPRTKLLCISPLPWREGARLQLRDSTDIIFLLRDVGRTNNFIKFSKDKGLPVEEDAPEVDAIAAAAAMNKVLDQLEDESEDVHHLETSVHICSSVVIDKGGAKKNEWKKGSLHVAGNWVLLTNDAVWSLLENPKNCPSDPIKCYHSQPMSNLMKVGTSGCRLTLEFLDETLGQEEVWQIETKTENTLRNVVYSLRLVWEPIFSVPLQVIEDQNDR